MVRCDLSGLRADLKSEGFLDSEEADSLLLIWYHQTPFRSRRDAPMPCPLPRGYAYSSPFSLTFRTMYMSLSGVGLIGLFLMSGI
jgi:hypothetical protein